MKPPLRLAIYIKHANLYTRAKDIHRRFRRDQHIAERYWGNRGLSLGRGIPALEAKRVAVLTGALLDTRIGSVGDKVCIVALDAVSDETVFVENGAVLAVVRVQHDKLYSTVVGDGERPHHLFVVAAEIPRARLVGPECYPGAADAQGNLHRLNGGIKRTFGGNFGQEVGREVVVEDSGTCFGKVATAWPNGYGDVVEGFEVAGVRSSYAVEEALICDFPFDPWTFC